MKTAILKSTCIALLMGNMFSCDVLDVEPLDSELVFTTDYYSIFYR